MLYKEIRNFNLTKVVLVNSFVAFVNCAKNDDCNIILFDVVIARFVVNFIKYSRTFASEFICLLYSFKADAFNTPAPLPCELLVPNGDIDILAAGIPPTEKKIILINYDKIYDYELLETALSTLSLFIVLNCCESEVIICPTIF